MPDAPRQPHPASLPDDELLARCTMSKSRTRGPGGQHRNKVETAVTLVYTPTGVSATAGERRSVRENKPVAVKRLRLNLAKEIRLPVPAGECRSDLWRSRCQNGRIICNPKHHDYPSLLAEALDVIEACNHDMPKAAIRLECSATQLCKLIQKHAPAWTALNKTRESLGLRVLR